ncbi:MAG: hypothetical protein LC655_00620, partial [Bacteroidales bacterium]|nr:hypothetical protein [Bacteroidales bacterium]
MLYTEIGLKAERLIGRCRLTPFGWPYQYTELTGFENRVIISTGWSYLQASSRPPGTFFVA